jgi:hypothetical protein
MPIFVHYPHVEQFEEEIIRHQMGIADVKHCILFYVLSINPDGSVTNYFIGVCRYVDPSSLKFLQNFPTNRTLQFPDAMRASEKSHCDL